MTTLTIRNDADAKEAVREIIETHGWALVLRELGGWITQRLEWKESGNKTLRFARDRINNVLWTLEDHSARCNAIMAPELYGLAKSIVWAENDDDIRLAKRLAKDIISKIEVNV